MWFFRKKKIESKKPEGEKRNFFLAPLGLHESLIRDIQNYSRASKLTMEEAISDILYRSFDYEPPGEVNAGS